MTSPLPGWLQAERERAAQAPPPPPPPEPPAPPPPPIPPRRVRGPRVPVTPEFIDPELAAQGLHRVTPPPRNTRDYFLALCDVCGRIRSVTVNRLRHMAQPHVRSVICKHSDASTIREGYPVGEVAAGIARTGGYEPVEEYPYSARIPWLMKCLTCGNEQYVPLRLLMCGRPRPACAWPECHG